LGAGESARIAPQEGEVRREILTKRHVRFDSCSIRVLLRLRPRFATRLRGRSQGLRTEDFSARPAPHAALEPISEFFVSTATAGHYLAAGWVLRIRFFDFGRDSDGRQLMQRVRRRRREG
ncbi:MAG TPA: hypothetical protein VF620_10115, partial [Allosphingosinicella sp.]